MAAAAHQSVPPAIPRPRVQRNRSFQRSFFCFCGRSLESRLALCRICAISQSYSKRYFGGHRTAILERDNYSCQSCGAGKWLNVHHRRPGLQDQEWLVTLCAGCHARVHRLQALRFWLPESILLLWTEQHPATPRQLQFELEEQAA